MWDVKLFYGGTPAIAIGWKIITLDVAAENMCNMYYVTKNNGRLITESKYMGSF